MRIPDRPTAWPLWPAACCLVRLGKNRLWAWKTDSYCKVPNKCFKLRLDYIAEIVINVRWTVWTWVADRWFVDVYRVVGQIVWDDESPVDIRQFIGVHLGEESQHVAVEASPVVAHELDEVTLRWLRNRHAQAVGQRVFLGSESVVRRNLARIVALRFLQRVQRTEVVWNEIICMLKVTTDYRAYIIVKVVLWWSYNVASRKYGMK